MGHNQNMENYMVKNLFTFLQKKDEKIKECKSVKGLSRYIRHTNQFNVSVIWILILKGTIKIDV